MVTLLARLDAEKVDWVGTSMGGLIGLGLAALPGSPMRRLVLNDVGPTIEPAALQRIGAYLGQPVRWPRVDEAPTACGASRQGFGPHSREQWLALTRPLLKPDGDGFKPHYDPAIAVPLRAVTPEMAAAGEAMLWASYDSLRCPTLLLRGADSDLLSAATAQAMTQRGPKARLSSSPASATRPRWCSRTRSRGAGVPAGAMKMPSAGRPRTGGAHRSLADVPTARPRPKARRRCPAGWRTWRAAARARLRRAAAHRPRARHRRRRAGPCRRRGRHPAGHRRGAVDARGGLPRLRRRLPAAPEEVVSQGLRASPTPAW
jgi:hypothetical protein